MRIYLLGYPGDLGGANTEAWHSIQLWRRAGIEVHLIPTWGSDARWQAKLDAIGCVTHRIQHENLERVPGLAGSITVGFCNSEYLAVAPRLRVIGCPIVWVNCMTFLFDRERKFYSEYEPADAMVFQSQYQRDLLEPQLLRYGYTPDRGHLIRGAFNLDGWDYRPRPHAPGEPFIVGRMARPDADKWSSNTWAIYNRIQYRGRRALMLGVNDSTHTKLGPTPEWAECLKPMAMPVPEYLAKLHCLLPVNGGARENWPRAGLEAMACGVPVVAQNDWGWREMIEHGVTGFLGSCDEELAHYTAMLAYDEALRMRIAVAARERLVNEFANSELFIESWNQLFEEVTHVRQAAG